jgi:hypothetical protein
LLGFRLVREPEFDRDSVNRMLAHLLIEEDRGPHGVSMTRATARDAKFQASPLPIHDKAAKAIATAKKKYYEAHKDAEREGDIWTVAEVTPQPE